MWSGKAAQALGLVDELGGLEPGHCHCCRVGRVRGRRLALAGSIPKETSGSASLVNSLIPEARRAAQTDPLTEQVFNVVEDANLVRTLNDPRGLYMLMPYTIRVD